MPLKELRFCVGNALTFGGKQKCEQPSLSKKLLRLRLSILEFKYQQNQLDMIVSVFAERGRKRPPPWTLPAHGFFLASLP